jgi:hypothetical protein
MKYRLQIKPEDCSRLGQEILKHMEENQISMREMARHVGITHEGLRSCCWHKAIPTELTLRNLSRVLKIPAEQLLKWVYEDKIRYGYQASLADALLQAVEDTIKLIRVLINNYPEEERPSDYEIIEQAIKQVFNTLRAFNLSEIKEEALVE